MQCEPTSSPPPGRTNRIELDGQSGPQKGMHSEPPPKDSANAKAVGIYLEDPRSLFVPWTMPSSLSAADIVFLVTVLPSLRVPLRSSYQQSILQPFFHRQTPQRHFPPHLRYQAFVRSHGSACTN